MYSRPQNYRYPNGVRLPENYGGSTFRDRTDEKDEPHQEENIEDKPINDPEPTNDGAQTAALLPKAGFKLRLGSLFGNNKGIGTEELLILALVLLLADTDGNDDLILFLILLFFIK